MAERCAAVRKKRVFLRLTQNRRKRRGDGNQRAEDGRRWTDFLLTLGREGNTKATKEILQKISVSIRVHL